MNMSVASLGSRVGHKVVVHPWQFRVVSRMGKRGSSFISSVSKKRDVRKSYQPDLAFAASINQALTGQAGVNVAKPSSPAAAPGVQATCSVAPLSASSSHDRPPSNDPTFLLPIDLRHR